MMGKPLGAIAQELNKQGYRTQFKTSFTPQSVSYWTSKVKYAAKLPQQQELKFDMAPVAPSIVAKTPSLKKVRAAQAVLEIDGMSPKEVSEMAARILLS